MYFNTPGSKVDRHLSANMILKKNEKTLEMNLISPWKKATFNGKSLNTRQIIIFCQRNPNYKLVLSYHILMFKILYIYIDANYRVLNR